MTGFPANGTAYRGRYFGPPKIATIMQRVLFTISTWGVSGQAGSGGVRVQDQSSNYAGWSYRGDPGPLQSFRGAAGFVGASAGGIRPGFNTVLPGTTALPAQVLNLLPGNPGG